MQKCVVDTYIRIRRGSRKYCRGGGGGDGDPKIYISFLAFIIRFYRGESGSVPKASITLFTNSVVYWCFGNCVSIALSLMYEISNV